MQKQKQIDREAFTDTIKIDYVRESRTPVLYGSTHYQRGAIAEWLGTGLQNLLHRFDSGSRLQSIAMYYFMGDHESPL